jgi:hypothetical protein
MRDRIYWLLPDLASARATLADLSAAGVDIRHVHFVAQEGCDLTGLHAANLLQTSDVVRSAETGLLMGAATGGLVGAVAAVGYPIVGEAPQWSLFAALTAAGAVFGTWAASMIGISTPSQRLRRFSGEIEEGRILLMVDVPVWRVQGIELLLQALHPEASLQGLEPELHAFP